MIYFMNLYRSFRNSWILLEGDQTVDFLSLYIMAMLSMPGIIQAKHSGLSLIQTILCVRFISVLCPMKPGDHSSCLRTAIKWVSYIRCSLIEVQPSSVQGCLLSDALYLWCRAALVSLPLYKTTAKYPKARTSFWVNLSGTKCFRAL